MALVSKGSMPRLVPRRALFILLFLASTSIFSAQSRISHSTFLSDPNAQNPLRAYDRSWALIVAIDKYTQTDPRLSSVLSGRRLKEILTSRYGFPDRNIITLFDEQARRTVVIDAIKRLGKRNPNDRVLLFFSGRGQTLKDESNHEFGFFIPYDGQIVSNESTVSTCLALEDIRKAVDLFGAKQTYVLLDFAVGGLPVLKRYSLAPARMGLQKIVELPVEEVFAAGDMYEPIVEKEAGGASLFTSSILETLSSASADKNGDGIISGTELAAAVAPMVSARSERTMHPQFGFMDEGKGDFLFVVPRDQDTSEVFFSIKPIGAQLYIDGRLQTATDFRIPVKVGRTGSHSIRVDRDGYNPLQSDIFVNGAVWVTVDVELEKKPVEEVLIRVNEPDAKIYFDGRFVGMPDQSLLLSPATPGTHSIRGELEGYFPDSATVTVEKPVRYTVDLKFRSRNGFITVRSSEGVNITLDGKEIGLREVIKKEVLPGSHSLRLWGIGYDPVEQAVLVGEAEEKELVIPMDRASLGGALWRSALYPGWGQWYTGRNGMTWATVFSVAALTTVQLHLAYTKAEDDYAFNFAQYKKATTTAEIGIYRQNVVDLNKRRGDLKNYRLAAAGFTGAWYLYNLYNVWTHDPADLIREEEERVKREKSAGVSLGIMPGGVAVSIEVRF